jgi:hypothetical protein
MPNLEHVTWSDPTVTPNNAAISSRLAPCATNSLILSIASGVNFLPLLAEGLPFVIVMAPRTWPAKRNLTASRAVGFYVGNPTSARRKPAEAGLSWLRMQGLPARVERASPPTQRQPAQSVAQRRGDARTKKPRQGRGRRQASGRGYALPDNSKRAPIDDD